MKSFENHYKIFIYPNIVGGFFLFRRIFNTNDKFDKNQLKLFIKRFTDMEEKTDEIVKYVKEYVASV